MPHLISSVPTPINRGDGHGRGNISGTDGRPDHFPGRVCLNRGIEEAAAEDSGFSENEGASLTGLAAVPKVVFSSTLQAPLTWPNSELVSGDAVEAVRGLKQTRTGTLSTLGSLSLARSLLTNGRHS